MTDTFCILPWIHLILLLMGCCGFVATPVNILRSAATPCLFMITLLRKSGILIISALSVVICLKENVYPTAHIAINLKKHRKAAIEFYRMPDGLKNLALHSRSWWMNQSHEILQYLNYRSTCSSFLAICVISNAECVLHYLVRKSKKTMFIGTGYQS